MVQGRFGAQHRSSARRPGSLIIRGTVAGWNEMGTEFNPCRVDGPPRLRGRLCIQEGRTA